MRHGALWAAHDGFDAEFAPLVAETLFDSARHHDPETEQGWTARAARGGRDVFLARVPRRVWVANAALVYDPVEPR